jgi:hypothetical protein
MGPWSIERERGSSQSTNEHVSGSGTVYGGGSPFSWQVVCLSEHVDRPWCACAEHTLTFLSGTFLTATPTGNLTATTPSRGPLESLTPTISLSSLFPQLSLKTHSEKYLSVATSSSTKLGSNLELRADAEEIGDEEKIWIKCQREYMFKARMAIAQAEGGSGGGGKGKERSLWDKGPAEGSAEDEMRRKWVEVCYRSIHPTARVGEDCLGRLSGIRL